MRITYSLSFGTWDVCYRIKGKVHWIKLSRDKFWKFVEWLNKFAEFQYPHTSNLNPEPSFSKGATYVLEIERKG